MKTTTVSPLRNEKLIALERFRVKASRYISGHTLAKMTLCEYKNVYNDLVEELITEIMAEEVGVKEKTVYFYTPTTWWDMFKQTYFKGWLLNKFPVKTTTHKQTVVFKTYATYPQLPKVFPDGVGDIKFKVVESLKPILSI